MTVERELYLRDLCKANSIPIGTVLLFNGYMTKLDKINLKWEVSRDYYNNPTVEQMVNVAFLAAKNNGTPYYILCSKTHNSYGIALWLRYTIKDKTNGGFDLLYLYNIDGTGGYTISTIQDEIKDKIPKLGTAVDVDGELILAKISLARWELKDGIIYIGETDKKEKAL